MRTIRTALHLALATAFATCLGCSPQSPTRTVTGQLRTAGMQLDNPVVIAEASDHRVFVTHLSARGTFKLELPHGVEYRLTLANSTRSGAYVTVARINWPLASGPARWAHVGAGAPLDLGAVFQRGTSPIPINTDLSTRTGGGGDGDHDGDDGDKDGDDGDKDGDDGDKDDDGDDDDDCEQDDDADVETSDDEKDCDCGNTISTGDNCGKDDDADEHEKACDDDDDDHACDGGCAGGGTAGGGTGGGTAGGGTVPAGGTCVVSADCSGGLSCVNSACTTSPVIP
jgi:hypothetical protein